MALQARPGVAGISICSTPTSGAHVVAGLRLAIARAILGVVVCEFFGASRRLGYMIASASSGYRADVMFAGVLVLMALSSALTFSVQAVEAPHALAPRGREDVLNPTARLDRAVMAKASDEIVDSDHLAVLAEPPDDFRHRAAVDLVVASDLDHQRMR
jgi:hypothetical protein